MKCYLKKECKDGRRQLVMQETRENMRLSFNTGIKLAPEDWNQDKQQCTNKRISKEINLRIAELRSMAERYLATCRGVSQDGFMRWMIKEDGGEVIEQATFFGELEKFMEKCPYRKNKDGETIADRTVARYEWVIKTLKEFEKNRGVRLTFATFDTNTLEEYQEFLLKYRNLAQNTLHRYFRELRAMFNFVGRTVEVNPAYKTYRVKLVKTDKVALTKEEVEKIFDFDCMGNGALQNARDLFIVGCCTGLRLSDVSRLGEAVINNDVLRMHTLKTGALVEIPLHPKLKEMLETRGLPHPISGQKLNTYLRQICQLLEINTPIEVKTVRGGKREVRILPKYELIKSHTARRTFATMLYKAGVPPRIIMGFTGHSSLDVFMNYVIIDNEDRMNAVRKVWETQYA